MADDDFPDIERFYGFLLGIAIFFSLFVLLAGYDLANPQLIEYGSIYFSMSILGVIFYVAYYVQGKATRTIGKKAAIGFIVGLGAMILWSDIGVLQITSTSPLITVLLFILTFVGGVSEESFFRVAAIRLLTPVLGKYGAVVAQAVGFGFFHSYKYSFALIKLIAAGLAGLSQGLIYVWSKSETAVCASHITYNLYVYAKTGVGIFLKFI